MTSPSDAHHDVSSDVSHATGHGRPQRRRSPNILRHDSSAIKAVVLPNHVTDVPHPVDRFSRASETNCNGECHCCFYKITLPHVIFCVLVT